MTLAGRAQELKVRIEGAVAGGEDEDNIAAGKRIQTSLQATSTINRALVSFLKEFGSVDRPSADNKGLRDEIDNFRNELADGAVAMGRKEASLIDSIDASRNAVLAWAKRFWTSQFEIAELVRRAGQLGIEVKEERDASNLSKKVERISRKNPLTEEPDINRELECSDAGSWKQAISAIVKKLEKSIEKAENKRNAYSEAVQDFIARVAGDGYPLKDVTTKLREELEEAGLLDLYKVRSESENGARP